MNLGQQPENTQRVGNLTRLPLFLETSLLDSRHFRFFWSSQLAIYSAIISCGVIYLHYDKEILPFEHVKAKTESAWTKFDTSGFD